MLALYFCPSTLIVADHWAERAFWKATASLLSAVPTSATVGQ